MLKNYFKTAWRSFRKNKLYSFVNIVGLTTGLAACMLIGIYIWNEVTYDRFHEKADRIVRVTSDMSRSGSERQFAQTGTKVGPEFKRTFPQVERYVRTSKYAHSVAIGQQSFEEHNVLYADADFFHIFSFPLLQGNANNVLDAPQKAVLSTSAAKKYFGNADPIGKTFRLDGGDREYEITGIAGDAPLNSQIQYDLIISFNTLNASKTEIWGTANYITYLLLQDASQIDPLATAVASHMRQVNQEEMSLPENDYWTFHLEPLQAVHLHSPLAGLESNGNITYIYVLSVVAVLILLIACVNYTNLAIAQSVNRGMEIGIRKVMGAGRPQLLKQFLGESILITSLALVLAVLISVMLLPLFNALTGKLFTAALFFKQGFLLSAAALSVLISLLAGAYPAVVLSSKKLVNILKSGLQVSHSGGKLRQGLIVFQFVIAIFLMAATVIVLNQVSFIQRKNLGYDRSHVLVLPIDGKTRPVYNQLKDAFRANPNVLSVTGAYEDPTSIGWGDGIEADDGTGPKELMLNATPVDLDYLKTMGMELAAGRDFTAADFAVQDTTANYANYRESYILNEKAVMDLGWTPEEAIGKTVSRGSPGTVVGVIKDFHFESLHEPIGPLLIFLDTTMTYQLFVKVKGEHLATTLTTLENAWKARVVHRPFDYHFMDDDFNALYKTEERIAGLFSAFATIAIVLACLGLFALAAFTTAQRTKEIGIRKVLGATLSNIVALVSKQFLLLVGIAVLIATPLAWWAGSNWLADFAYRVDITWWIFAFAGIMAALIALATVSFHAIRAATANPVESLRDE
ncbi:ABC transporter permease [Parapedobacter koreensis]|uniref:Putative ABC transport system permease protein n=1 Tax=Parapedobacter koreensis TaxID=332977 RepID=A0A1H7R2D2_9SPHI|nr:ABC transporter permease [Parapedobacter koreensis]SEL54138.1 putative ABC transport system permease protein [Parapedobacter koreensis]